MMKKFLVGLVISILILANVAFADFSCTLSSSDPRDNGLADISLSADDGSIDSYALWSVYASEECGNGPDWAIGQVPSGYDYFDTKPELTIDYKLCAKISQQDQYGSGHDTAFCDTTATYFSTSGERPLNGCDVHSGIINEDGVADVTISAVPYDAEITRYALWSVNISDSCGDAGVLADDNLTTEFDFFDEPPVGETKYKLCCKTEGYNEREQIDTKFCETEALYQRGDYETIQKSSGNESSSESGSSGTVEGDRPTDFGDGDEEEEDDGSILPWVLGAAGLGLLGLLGMKMMRGGDNTTSTPGFTPSRTPDLTPPGIPSGPGSVTPPVTPAGEEMEDSVSQGICNTVDAVRIADPSGFSKEFVASASKGIHKGVDEAPSASFVNDTLKPSKDQLEKDIDKFIGEQREPANICGITLKGSTYVAEMKPLTPNEDKWLFKCDSRFCPVEDDVKDKAKCTESSLGNGKCPGPCDEADMVCDGNNYKKSEDKEKKKEEETKPEPSAPGETPVIQEPKTETPVSATEQTKPDVPAEPETKEPTVDDVLGQGGSAQAPEVVPTVPEVPVGDPMIHAPLWSETTPGSNPTEADLADFRQQLVDLPIGESRAYLISGDTTKVGPHSEVLGIERVGEDKYVLHWLNREGEPGKYAGIMSSPSRDWIINKMVSETGSIRTKYPQELGTMSNIKLQATDYKTPTEYSNAHPEYGKVWGFTPTGGVIRVDSLITGNVVADITGMATGDDPDPKTNPMRIVMGWFDGEYIDTVWNQEKGKVQFRAPGKSTFYDTLDEAIKDGGITGFYDNEKAELRKLEQARSFDDYANQIYTSSKDLDYAVVRGSGSFNPSSAQDVKDKALNNRPYYQERWLNPKVTPTSTESPEWKPGLSMDDFDPSTDKFVEHVGDQDVDYYFEPSADSTPENPKWDLYSEWDHPSQGKIKEKKASGLTKEEALDAVKDYQKNGNVDRIERLEEGEEEPEVIYDANPSTSATPKELQPKKRYEPQICGKGCCEVAFGENYEWLKKVYPGLATEEMCGKGEDVVSGDKELGCCEAVKKRTEMWISQVNGEKFLAGVRKSENRADVIESYMDFGEIWGARVQIVTANDANKDIYIEKDAYGKDIWVKPYYVQTKGTCATNYEKAKKVCTDTVAKMNADVAKKVLGATATYVNEADKQVIELIKGCRDECKKVNLECRQGSLDCAKDAKEKTNTWIGNLSKSPETTRSVPLSEVKGVVKEDKLEWTQPGCYDHDKGMMKGEMDKHQFAALGDDCAGNIMKLDWINQQGIDSAKLLNTILPSDYWLIGERELESNVMAKIIERGIDDPRTLLRYRALNYPPNYNKYSDAVLQQAFASQINKPAGEHYRKAIQDNEKIIGKAGTDILSRMGRTPYKVEYPFNNPEELGERRAEAPTKKASGNASAAS